MKSKTQKLIALLLLSAILICGCGHEAEKPAAVLHSITDAGYIPVAASPLTLNLSSPQAFVYDVAAGEFLYISEEGRGEILYPASTTKLVVIMYALTLLSPDELVTPGDEISLLGENSTIAYIKPHHTLTVEMLIEGMLLPSGNDAAYALAAAAGKKLSGEEGGDITGTEAVSLFVRGMNEYAAGIGMCGSNFTSPDGYYDENHYTTVEDMAIISALAAKNDLIMKYAGLYSDNVVYASGHTNTWVNTNLMLDPDSKYYSPYVTGLKTGSAGAGNYSLIITADINSQKYIIGLFSGKNESARYRDAKIIIDSLI